jgi:2,3-bisphosphoglycerate-independent phosphoglycerate mutase
LKGPLLLVVLDGWGYREAVESNAILAKAPYFHDLWARYPRTLLDACGREVGLPLGIMGNSEVGHMNLGAGQVVYQDISRIDKSIEEEDFFENGALVEVMQRTRREGKHLHLAGLVSDGGVHASDHHLRNLLVLAARQGLARDKVLVHAITDGRDTPPRSGAGYLQALQGDLQSAGVGRVASVVGRYWAMDRDNRWERVQRAYDLFVSGVGQRADDPVAAMHHSYEADVGDEFVEPTVIGAPDEGRFSDGDGLILFNYRSDRMRQLCQALAFEDFDGFERGRRIAPDLVTFTRYRADFPFPVAYPPIEVRGIFPELVSRAGLSQKRIAETEKYAHVTFFFSGGEEAPYEGEERILVPSPKVATYDLQPEMSAAGVTDAIVDAVDRGETDVFVINYANADMVGHTGIYEAAEVAVATIDACLRRVVEAVRRHGGVVAITADHGNSEQLWDGSSEQPHTAHTLNPVPLVLVGDDLLGATLRARGVLADVAPTLLELLEVEPSAEMDGTSLLVR